MKCARKIAQPIFSTSLLSFLVFFYTIMLNYFDSFGVTFLLFFKIIFSFGLPDSHTQTYSLHRGGRSLHFNAEWIVQQCGKYLLAFVFSFTISRSHVGMLSCYFAFSFRIKGSNTEGRSVVVPPHHISFASGTPTCYLKSNTQAALCRSYLLQCEKVKPV